MQNLTAECGLCRNSPVIYPAILPYVLISLPANGWVLWLMISSPVKMFFCSDNVKSVGMTASCLLLVFIVNSFCCLSVLRALKQPSPGEGERERSNLIKKRAFNLVLIFQVTTFVGFVPPVTMVLLVGKIDMETLCIWQPLAYSMMIWLGLIYPLLYLRRAGKHLVPKKLRMCKLF